MAQLSLSASQGPDGGRGGRAFSDLKSFSVSLSRLPDTQQRHVLCLPMSGPPVHGL